MAVFRVERNTGYTVMSNHHLRNKELTLKAKGLLSQMLSLPEDWDYTLAGLSHINREKIDAIREAVKELEKAGYIVRSRERDEKGRLRGADYVIYEQPQPREPEAAPSGEQPPTLDYPTLDNPTLEKPTQEKPTLENPTQLNKDISSTHSFPFHSPNPLPFAQDEAATPPERKRTEAKSNSAVEIYREIIKDNIEYDHLIQNCKIDADRLNEIVDLMLETVCTARKTIRIAGDDYPAELVKSKFLKLNSSHIEFVLDCMRENTTKVRNIKQYENWMKELELLPEQVQFSVQNGDTLRWDVISDKGIPAGAEAFQQGSVMIQFDEVGSLSSFTYLINWNEYAATEDIISESQAFEQVKDGNFEQYIPFQPGDTLYIDQCKFTYLYDTKGFYQPVYEFSGYINNRENLWVARIPAMAE